MPAKAKHRRPKQHPIARKLAFAGTGSAALALPLISATTAGAAVAQPAAVSAATMSAVAPAAAVTVEKAALPVTYSVVGGDTLSKIAVEHSVSGGWQALYEANRSAIGANPSIIRPGLKLTIGTAAKAAAARAKATVAKPVTAYGNNLDGWIRQSLDIMAKHGIPGSYNGIHRNVMRESSGNPLAINNWDSNAAAGIPSKGLLQVIDPTFRAYHVPGTSLDSYDPVANITAACNYAAARYGSIDNVNGPY
ncbi:MULTISPECIES: LysM peptidoglycan-binding domain-containing protein [unclassified Streptomyces]|uniref:LysM peptidoglycan-binding domain-containing protein n=1 Tax=unclassified Streptomyces TaxID=2593676 RepID=UPI001BE7461F|nr:MULTISPECIES: LysM peptidoglycan-binding domain-containing protein [unclassified Streptomyces]MBT2405177.1 LysM peptidoglycan-binding domain-containing protein [Streptomyces sp. ISL-21]MBT2454769.1 LysM peptidoglycan-binding domain-containing protein [Streptomyces sp. ISL-86]MBT2610945.1 LysM peptidoglycan-binding domain-containing protein [Streptomyces sp. ISL-87]